MTQYIMQYINNDCFVFLIKIRLFSGNVFQKTQRMSDFELSFVLSCRSYLLGGVVAPGFPVDNVVKIVAANLE